MKKKFVSVLLAAMTLAFATGCASDDPEGQTEESPVILSEEEPGTEPETVSEPETESESEAVPEQMAGPQDSAREKLEECFALIGKDDAAAAELLGGGKENIAGDGVTKVGRIYSLELFGEEVEAGSLYDENNCVYSVTMQLQNPDASVYAEQLKAIYGEPEAADDAPSESGSTWQSWNIGGIQLKLWQGYGLTSLEIARMPEAGGEAAIDTDALFTGWLPQGVEQIKAETEPNELLRQAIVDYYEIPEEYWEQTKYYYNYVDLNGDGTEEIFAVVMGSYTSGSGGNSALWCREHEGEMEIMQAFTLVNTPVIVTKDALNGQEYGARGLIMQRSGGGAEAEIVQLTCSDGVYTNVADAPVIEDIEDIQGTAILCNNLIEDAESGNYLTLAE